MRPATSTNDTLHSYVYDAENRVVQVDSGTTASYVYSGPFRIKKTAGGSTTIYIFSGVKVIAEYVNSSLSREYIYAGSQLLATIEGSTTKYHHSDHLSVRVTTDAQGAKLGEQGHYPFGESWYSISNTTKWQFTSYERDAESGLDYAIFRYHSSRLGRFLTPDPLAGTIFNPQALNRYAYVINDPINLIDPLGLHSCPPGCQHAPCPVPDDCLHDCMCNSGYGAGGSGRGRCGFQLLDGSFMEVPCDLFGGPFGTAPFDPCIITSGEGHRSRQAVDVETTGINTGESVKSPITGRIVDKKTDGTGPHPPDAPLSFQSEADYVIIEGATHTVLMYHVFSPLPTGAWVEADNDVGHVNETGRTKGPHAHVRVYEKSSGQFIDPELFLPDCERRN